MGGKEGQVFILAVMEKIKRTKEGIKIQLIATIFQDGTKETKCLAGRKDGRKEGQVFILAVMEKIKRTKEGIKIQLIAAKYQDGAKETTCLASLSVKAGEKGQYLILDLQEGVFSFGRKEA